MRRLSRGVPFLELRPHRGVVKQVEELVDHLVHGCVRSARGQQEGHRGQTLVHNRRQTSGRIDGDFRVNVIHQPATGRPRSVVRELNLKLRMEGHRGTDSVSRPACWFAVAAGGSFGDIDDVSRTIRCLNGDVGD